nr:Chain B, Peptide aldehyde inhibitor [Drosophila melanogaster]6PJQ_B Chain B, Peptide aldehyde inhibitor [Drosophila melanogaster]6PJR_B Chain B, Peptide aldehyde inhibitor [Drosophila melanogaster]6PJU_B Chain B, Peptide aldehyde inhibitor [Drosophila melanogaster]
RKVRMAAIVFSFP